MTDLSLGFVPTQAPRRASRRTARRRGALEYHAYHAVVFGAVLPVATAAFALDALRGRPGASPFRRAQRQAWAIVPMIFAP
jgi:hypothetical protein